MGFPVTAFHIISNIVYRTRRKFQIVRKKRGRESKRKVYRTTGKLVDCLRRQIIHTLLYSSARKTLCTFVCSKQGKVNDAVAFRILHMC